MGKTAGRAWGVMVAATALYTAVILGFDALTGSLLQGATSESNNEIALSALMSGLGFAAFIGLLAVEVRTYRATVRSAGEGLEASDKVLLGFTLWFFGNLPLSVVTALVQIRAAVPLSDMRPQLAQIALSLALLVVTLVRFRRK